MANTAGSSVANSFNSKNCSIISYIFFFIPFNSTLIFTVKTTGNVAVRSSSVNLMDFCYSVYESIGLI